MKVETSLAGHTSYKIQKIHHLIRLLYVIIFSFSCTKHLAKNESIFQEKKKKNYFIQFANSLATLHCTISVQSLNASVAAKSHHHSIKIVEISFHYFFAKNYVKSAYSLINCSALYSACGNHGNILSHFFDKIFVKATFLLKKFLKSRFHEIILGKSMFLSFTHDVVRTLHCNLQL